MPYEIVTRQTDVDGNPMDNAPWTNDECGDPNRFDSYDDALEAIDALVRNDPDTWRREDMDVREITKEED